MKYAFFIAPLFSLLITSQAFALVYDEAEVVDTKLFVTRLDFEHTEYFECARTCKEVDSIPSGSPTFTTNPFSASLVTSVSQNLPPTIRSLRSPDGRFLATWRSDGMRRVIQVIDSLTAKSVQHEETVSNEILLEETRLLAWQGSTLYYLSDTDGRRGVYALDPLTLTRTKVAGGNFEIAEFLPLPDGRLLFVGNPDDPYKWNLYLLEGSVAKEIDEDVSNVSQLTLIENTLYYSKQTNAGYEVFSYDLKRSNITKLKLPKVNESEVVKGLTYETKTYGKLPSVLVKLLNKSSRNSKEKIKIIVWLHGGPHRQAAGELNSIRSYGTYDAMLAQIAGETGSALVKIDYPGSVGHGSALANSIYYEVGGADVEELTEAIEEAKKETGAEEVYLGGTSYGGYLALKMLAEKPDLVDGVLSINPVTNWRQLFDSVKGSPLIKLFGVTKETVPESLWAQADIGSKIKNISDETPIIIAYGDQDNNVPFTQSIGMIELLTVEKKNIDALVLQDEKHTIIKKKSIETLCKSMLSLLGSRSKSCKI